MTVEGKQNQFGVVFQIEHLHDVVLVEHDRLFADLDLP
jgi:hypothetical protein